MLAMSLLAHAVVDDNEQLQILDSPEFEDFMSGI